MTLSILNLTYQYWVLNKIGRNINFLLNVSYENQLELSCGDAVALS